MAVRPRRRSRVSEVSRRGTAAPARAHAAAEQAARAVGAAGGRQASAPAGGPRSRARAPRDGDRRARGLRQDDLLASWLAADPACRCAWVSLDERDADSARMLAHVTEALLRADPAIARALPRSGAPATRQAALTALANGLETAGVPLVLVLDDCHLVSGSASLEVLGFLVEHLPEPVRVVLAMRGEPAVPLGRLRARGELLEIRAHDLRFTAREARELLQGSFGLDLDAPDVAPSRRADRGLAGRPVPRGAVAARPSRPAGVRARLRGRPPPRRRVPHGGGAARRAARGARVPRPHLAARAAVRRPLRRDAGAHGVGRAAGRAGAAQPVPDRARRASRGYRYHHLFAEFLRGQLVAAEPELVPELHRRAAAWLRATSDVNMAITTRRPAAPTRTRRT